MNQKFSGICNGKVAVIGAGFVGSSIAYALTLKNIASEIILIDINTTKADGEALDIQHGVPFLGTTRVRAGDYTDCADCDMIILTVGRNRRKGESRLDLMNDNYRILKSVTDEIKKNYTRGVILVVSNPVDIMTYLCDKWMGLPRGRVFGTGCSLDTSRLISSVADYAKVSTEAVKCNIVGEHGDTQFPVWSQLSIAGLSITEYCEKYGLEWNEEIQDKLYGAVRNMGATIIAEKERTHFGIATCVCAIADAVINQRPYMVSVASVLDGEYGVSDVALSVPSIVGVNGVETRLEENWTEKEIELLNNSVDKLRETISLLYYHANKAV